MIDLSEIRKYSGNPLGVYPDARGRWNFFRALQANKELDQAQKDPQESAGVLSRFIFDMHPDELDLAPARAFRYKESVRVMEEFPNGKDILESEILAHFQRARERIDKGYVLVKASTIINPDNPNNPRSEDTGGGDSGQRVNIPPDVQRRAAIWNDFAQKQIRDGNTDQLFTSAPLWLSTKLAEGTHLQMGNIVVEVGDGMARIRTQAHREKGVEKRWGLDKGNEWGAGLNQWFAMSHIAEKDLLKLSESLGEGMIDGMKLTPEVYAKSYIPILKLIELNPQLQIKGVLSDGSWIYSGELARAFPEHHISGIHDIAGDVVDIGTAEELGVPIQAYFATLNPERAKAYEEGRYMATVAARFIDPEGMRNVIDQFGLAA